jgi:outer membrane receptor for ferrienterochelin and colicins
VTRANASGAVARIQGLDARYLLVLVNGERVAGRVDGAIDLSRFALEDVQRIEIVRGPSSALYGADAIGGVVNLITRRALRPWEGTVHLRHGALDTFDATGRGAMRRGAWGVSLSGGYHRRDAFDLNPSDAATDGSAIESGEASAHAAWHLGTTFTLTSRADWFMRNQRAVDTSVGGAIFDRRNLTESFAFALAAALTLGAERDTKLRLSLWYTRYRDQFLRDQRGDDALDQYQQTHNQIANVSLQVDQAVGTRHQVTLGIEGYFEGLDADRLRNTPSLRQRVAFYAQDQWTLLVRPRLVFVPGFRYDTDSQFGSANTPKVQLRFDPRPGLAVRASFGMGFRAPSFQELYLFFENPSAAYLVEGNPTLSPERSRALNVGVEWRATRAIWTSLNLFRNDIDGLIVATTTGPGREATRYRYQNLDAAWTMGLELTARLRPLPSVTIDLGYTLTATRDVAAARPLEGRALHRGNVGVQFRHAHTGTMLSGRLAVVGPRPFYSIASRDEAPTYASLDLRLSYAPRRALSVFVGCDNVFDVGDSDVLRLTPRTLYVGVTLQPPEETPR